MVCSDLESVFIPEVWINLSKRTGIKELMITTKDEADYDKLMKFRLGVLKEKGLKLIDLQNALNSMEPYEGAVEFINWVRERVPLTVLSDTFMDVIKPMIPKLGYPSLFCHSLVIGSEGSVEDYKLRITDHKRKTVEAYQKLNYKVIAFGDSYNDVNMIKAADVGVLFKAPKNVCDEFPEIPSVDSYDELRVILGKYI